MRLSTDRVFIRPLRIEDSQVSFAWRNDPEIWIYTGSRPDRPITPEIELEWARRVLADKSAHRFAICVREDTKTAYVGNAQLTGADVCEAEYHIFIGDRSYWGKGIGKKATELVLSYAFKELHLGCVKLRVRNDHRSAIAVYEKCGFVVDGTTSPNPVQEQDHLWLHMIRYKDSADDGAHDSQTEEGI